MQDQALLEVQQGIWIHEQWIREAGLGSRLRVVIHPGEIRILPGPGSCDSTDKVVESQAETTRGWDVFRRLGDNAPEGRLSNAAVDHDHYLYGKSR